MLKDPFILEFLDLAERPRWRERDLQQAIIDRLESFLLELGKGFCFVARQKRITLDGDHFFVDLVFYNRLLRCFVLVDLKLDKLTHQDLGQMQMYVNLFDATERADGEAPTTELFWFYFGAPMTDQLVPSSDALVRELRALVAGTRGRVAQTVNSELVGLYWQVGKRIREEVLRDERATYGEQVIAEVAKALTADFGRGFSKRNLHHMIRFAEVYPRAEIVHALRSQLSWTHFRELVAIEDPLKRQFYAEFCRVERWSTRTLKSKMDGMLFERTAIAKRPDAIVEDTLQALAEEDRMSPDLVFRDPYVLDFLALPSDFSEAEFETAILRELEAFLLELGDGFSVIARQKRMSIGADDYYLDLLFFHRRLRALVAIELKLGRFNARDKGQMELYLRWLDKHERQPDENPPLGLILCADKNDEQIELLELSEGSVRVASYLTELPPRELLERKLLESIKHAQSRLPTSEHLPSTDTDP